MVSVVKTLWYTHHLYSLPQAEFSGGVLVCNGVIALRRVRKSDFSETELGSNYMSGRHVVIITSWHNHSQKGSPQPGFGKVSHVVSTVNVSPISRAKRTNLENRPGYCKDESSHSV